MLNPAEPIGKVIRKIQSIIAGERGVLLITMAALAIGGGWYYLKKTGFRVNREEIKKQLNIINVSIVLLLIVGIAWGFKLSSAPASPIYLILTHQRQLDREFPPPEYWSVASLKIGDISYNSLGHKVAEIVDIKRSYWGADRENFQVTLKVDAVKNSLSGEYTIDGKPLMIGNKLSLPLGYTQFNGVISDIYQDEQERLTKYRRAKATVKLKGRFYEPWQAEALRDFTVKNSKTEVVAQTKNILIEPAEYVFTTNAGKVLRLRDPIKKDVTLTLEMFDVLCAEQTCYFEEFKPLKIGHDLWMTSDKAVIPGANIMDFQIEYMDN